MRRSSKVADAAGAAVDFGAIEGAARLAIQRDGRLVVAGLTAMTIGMSTMGPFVVHADIGLARFLPDGALDPSFGHGGKITVPLSERDVDFGRFGLALLPDDALVVMVKELPSRDRSAALLLRFTADGMLDSSFGDGGQVALVLDTLHDPMAVAAQPDGRLVVASRGGQRPFSVLTPSFSEDGRVEAFPGEELIVRGLSINARGAILVRATDARRETRSGAMRYAYSIRRRRRSGCGLRRRRSSGLG